MHGSLGPAAGGQSLKQGHAGALMQGRVALQRWRAQTDLTARHWQAEPMQFLAGQRNFCHRTSATRIRPETKQLLEQPTSAGEQCSAAQERDHHASVGC